MEFQVNVCKDGWKHMMGGLVNGNVDKWMET